MRVRIIFFLETKGQHICYDTDLLMMIYPPFTINMTYVYTFCEIQKLENENQIFLDGDTIVEGAKHEMLRRMEIVETVKRDQKAQTESQRSPSHSTHLPDRLVGSSSIFAYICTYIYIYLNIHIHTFVIT